METKIATITKICDNCLYGNQPIGLIVEIVDHETGTCEIVDCGSVYDEVGD